FGFAQKADDLLVSKTFLHVQSPRGRELDSKLRRYSKLGGRRHSDVPQGWMSTSACWLSVNHFPVIGSAANAGVLDTARAKARQRVAEITWLIGFVQPSTRCEDQLACSPG
ncbi:hypothetical protein, partial [Xanthomonas hortorum]